jgi:type II secretory pathway component PulK
MKLRPPEKRLGRRRENGSVLIIVLWVAIGLVSIALYFANSMNYELRASDNRVNGLAAEQAIEGAARYMAYTLQTFATNGAVPDNTQFRCEAVPVGDAKFWLIGRDLSAVNPTEPVFGLVDEGSKLNLNTVNTNVLSYLPNMTIDFANAIEDWRGSNGIVSLNYAAFGYVPKNAPFETVDELRLVYGATSDLLVGEDLNRNGVLDKSEKDLNGNGQLDPGLLEYTTIYTREPNFHADGSSLTNVNTFFTSAAQFRTFLQNAGVSGNVASYLYNDIKGGPNGTPPANPCKGILDFALRCRNAGMSSDDFSKIANNITTADSPSTASSSSSGTADSTGVTYFTNRLNINTASLDVLTAMFVGLTNTMDEQTAEGAAQTVVTYRQQNPNNLSSVAWLYDALGSTSPILTELARGDYITTKSYQFTADIAAVGAFGRGYRRVKFIFDISEGAPKILYRQDLSRLGWALGEKARQNLVAKDTQ